MNADQQLVMMENFWRHELIQMSDKGSVVYYVIECEEHAKAQDDMDGYEFDGIHGENV